MATAPSDNKDTDRARFTEALGISRLKAVILDLLLKDVNTAATKIATVVTLIPPAVDPEAPPININNIYQREVCCSRWEKSKVLNPAVRPLTALNRDEAIFSWSFMGPRVSGLLYSPANRVTAPRMVRIALVQSINLVFSDHLLNLNLFLDISDRVKYPMLPAMIKAVIIAVEEYPYDPNTKPCCREWMSKPELLNAETAWKREPHMVSSRFADGS